MKPIPIVLTLFFSLILLNGAWAARDDRFEARTTTLEMDLITFVDGNLQIGNCHVIIFEGGCLKNMGLTLMDLKALLAESASERTLIGYETRPESGTPAFGQTCSKSDGQFANRSICLQAIIERPR